jgi:hypothetical protein
MANAIGSTASNQVKQRQRETCSLVAILEEKWAEVMSKDQAGHFIHECQELRDQVQQMITQDSRYQVLKAIRAARWR